MLSLDLGLAGKTDFVSIGSRRNKRLYAANSNLVYILLPVSWGNAIALRLERNIGGASAADAGAPWAVWRRTGCFEVPGVLSDPAAPLFTYGSDVGAFDYAFMESSTGKFGGSYHGGETIVAEQWYADHVAFNPSAGDIAASIFRLVRTSTITYAPGKTLDVTYELTINADASLTEKAAFASDAAFTSARFAGMDILSRYFDEVRLPTGVLDVEAIASYDLTANDAADVTYRSRATGHTVKLTSNIPSAAGYLKTYIASQSGRIKHYPQFASTSGGALPPFSYERTIIYGKQQPNRFVYSVQRDGLSGSTRAGEAAPTIDTSADPDVLVFDRSRTATAWIDRGWTLGNLERGVWRINLNVVRSGAGSLGTSLIVTKAVNGSVTTPAPMAQQGFTSIADHYDFTVDDDNLDPITMRLRMGTAAGSTDTIRVSSFDLEKL